MGEMALGRSDGALLIGDPALLADPGSLRCYDLGEEWFRFTGLPFVFAVWAGRDRECVRQAGPDLVRAMRLGRSEIPRLAAESAGPLGIPAELCEDYLSHYIIHDVGPAEMEGYAAFRDMIIGTSTKGDQNR
jgi:chorismate dehydratase